MELKATELFESICLAEMQQVKLMNRIDLKYWFHANQLSELLEAISNDYYLLHIDNDNLLEYNTVYYDTATNRMFGDHHNGKLNRYKVRRRSYVSSGISFFEVKSKNNKGRTNKDRIPTDFANPSFTDNEKDFLSEITPFTHSDLQASLVNNFHRLTLVNKDFTERCTIDLKLQFQSDNKQISLHDLVVVELKTDGRAKASPLQMAMRNQRIKAAGFSKYCVGRTMTDSTIKRNAFKGKIRSIEKLLNTRTSLYN